MHCNYFYFLFSSSLHIFLTCFWSNQGRTFVCVLFIPLLVYCSKREWGLVLLLTTCKLQSNLFGLFSKRGIELKHYSIRVLLLCFSVALNVIEIACLSPIIRYVCLVSQSFKEGSKQRRFLSFRCMSYTHVSSLNHGFLLYICVYRAWFILNLHCRLHYSVTYPLSADSLHM